MNKKISIRFHAKDIPGEAAAILLPTGCGPDVAKVSDYTIVNVRTVHVSINLDQADERVGKVLALLGQYGVEVDAKPYIEYSEEDRQKAHLLWMSPPDVNDSCYAGLSLGTEYDMTHACPNCGTGAKQTSALYVEDTYLAKIRKHRAIGSMGGDILVDGGMVKKLKDAGVTGISFGDVRARLKNGGWTSVARDQILVEHVMPPAHAELTADDRAYLCNVCRRGGRISSPNKPYRAEDLRGVKDFNLTWEWFGVFGPADAKHRERRSHPIVLVTPKVMNVFRDAGVTTFQWTPVAIEE